MMRETRVSISSSINTIPPGESAWIKASEISASRWQSFSLPSQSAIPFAISRVNQVDAARLAVKMSAMLKEELVKVFSVMKLERAWKDLDSRLGRNYGVALPLLVASISGPV